MFHPKRIVDPTNMRLGVNFANILQAAFSYESFLHNFLCLQFGFVIFWKKDFDAKTPHKMMVKLSLG
jgi:hypothetical protein